MLALLAVLAGNGLIAFGQTAAAPPAVDVFDPATGMVRQLAVGGEPAWSPDGSKLAYVRDGQVYVANADGTGEVAVGAGRYPSWSPDGSALAVSRADGFGILQVFVLHVSDGSATQLTFGTANALLPAWSPAGTAIVFDTQSSLDAVPPQGGAVSAIPLPVQVAGGVGWSADGGRFAFVAANGQVWLANADGSNAHQLTYTLDGAESSPERPAWSPDGGQIAWAQGADLCTTDTSGTVRRLTFTQQGAPTFQASLPSWQPTSQASGGIVAAASGPSNTQGCDFNPGVRVEMFDSNVSSNAVALKTPQQLVFVNHTTHALTVSLSLNAQQATVDPGGFAAFPTQPGSYTFMVTGYPDGVARRGTFNVAAAGSVTIEEHASIRYGTSTVITGAATGAPGGAVVVKAQARDAAAYKQVATVKPVSGRWRLAVAPRITTRYLVTYEGAAVDRLLRVRPDLRVARNGAAVRITLKPAAALKGRPVFLFRLGAGGGWNQVRLARIGRSGAVLFAKLPAGRYYVGFQGNDRYWSTASEPFSIRR